MRPFLLFVILSLVAMACQTRKANQADTVPADSLLFKKGSFGFDLAFLKRHEKVIELGAGPARVLIAPDYQGRVMTSTARGETGNSYGWINYQLIGSDSLFPHFNPYGGEDRIWLGPEGGQYSVFFKKGTSFDFQNWQTPSV